MAREGRVGHDHLFFTNSGRPIADLKYPYTRWQRTLQRLAIRYRKPYMARHTSVSWNLMVGRNPLLVAKEHGHRPTTMLSVYAAWTEGAVEADIAAIREAMNCADGDADVDHDWTGGLTSGQTVASTSIRARKGRLPGWKAIWQQTWQ